MASNKSITIAAAALVLVGGGLWFMSRGNTSGGAGEDSDEEATVPKELVLEFFAELKKTMPIKMAPLMQQLEQVKAANPTVSDQQLMSIVAQHFDKTLTTLQTKLADEFGVEESEIETSTNVFMKQRDDDISAAVNDFRQLYASFGGQIIYNRVDVELPADLDEDKMCAVHDAFTKARDKGNDEIVQELQRYQGKLPEAVQRDLTSRMQAMVTAALKEYGFTELMWVSAIKEFMKKSPKFRVKFDEDASEQAQRMERLQRGQY